MGSLHKYIMLVGGSHQNMTGWVELNVTSREQ